MRCSTIMRLLILFITLLISHTIAQTPQTPLLLSDTRYTLARIAILKTNLMVRMSRHHSILSTHLKPVLGLLNDMTTALTITATKTGGIVDLMEKLNGEVVIKLPTEGEGEGGSDVKGVLEAVNGIVKEFEGLKTGNKEVEGMMADLEGHMLVIGEEVKDMEFFLRYLRKEMWILEKGVGEGEGDGDGEKKMEKGKQEERGKLVQ